MRELFEIWCMVAAVIMVVCLLLIGVNNRQIVLEFRGKQDRIDLAVTRIEKNIGVE